MLTNHRVVLAQHHTIGVVSSVLSRHVGVPRAEPQPTSPPSELKSQEDFMKVRASLRSLKDKPGSKVVRRPGRTYVINKTNPRWKGRQA